MLVRPAMKRLFCLKAKNGLGRFAPSALPHYKQFTPRTEWITVQITQMVSHAEDRRHLIYVI